MKNFKNILCSPLFLVSLFVLLLNDFLLKEVYGNFLTGKLSDISGIIVFVLFFTATFPNKKTFVFGVTVIAFVFWKSTLSQGFINGWNQSISFFQISRVVDYNDLYCLLVLIPVYRNKSKPFQISKFVVYPISLLTVFAITATSKRRPLLFDSIIVNKSFKVDYSERDLLLLLNFGDYDYELDSIPIIQGSDTLAQLHIRNIALEKDTIQEMTIGFRPLKKKTFIFIQKVQFSRNSEHHAGYASTNEYDKLRKKYGKISKQYMQELMGK